MAGRLERTINLEDISPLRTISCQRTASVSRWSKDFNDFLKKCLIKDPSQRPTADQLLGHKFVNELIIDRKPVCDLIAEYKADVTVEELEEEDVSVSLRFWCALCMTSYLL